MLTMAGKGQVPWGVGHPAQRPSPPSMRVPVFPVAAATAEVDALQSVPGKMQCRATQRVESGIGVKMSEGIMFMSGMIGGFVLGFYYEAAFTAILIATTPLLGICGWYLQKVTLLGEKVDDAYGKVR